MGSAFDMLRSRCRDNSEVWRAVEYTNSYQHALESQCVNKNTWNVQIEKKGSLRTTPRVH